ncbi:MAG: hypothetical protein ACJ8DV_27325, partial [Microvirga sp.]
ASERDNGHRGLPENFQVSGQQWSISGSATLKTGIRFPLTPELADRHYSSKSNPQGTSDI